MPLSQQVAGLPPHLLARIDFIAACNRRDFSEIFRLIRKYAGFSSSKIARLMETTPGHIGRVLNNGSIITTIDVIERAADGLRIPGALLGLAARSWESEHQTQGVQATPEPADQAIPAERVPQSVLVKLASDEADVAAMRAFRSADLRLGGGYLYASVLNYLQTDMAARLFGGSDSMESETTFTAAAALTEMAGWMAHDAGHDRAAEQHFSRSLSMVKAGNDQQLTAHVLGSMSHLASHLIRPRDAIGLARRGQSALQGTTPHHGLAARLLALEARGLAALREADECNRLLAQAERTLTGAEYGPTSPWVSHFDEGSLANETARCMIQLGDWSEARRQAELIVTLRPSSRTRSRAFGQLTVARALIKQNKLDVACGVVREVLDSTQALGSFQVVQKLLDVRQQLASCSSSRSLTEFLDYMDATLRERVWLCQWIPESPRGTSAVRQEHQ